MKVTILKRAEQQPNHSVPWDLQELYHITGQLSHVKLTPSKKKKSSLGHRGGAEQKGGVRLKMRTPVQPHVSEAMCIKQTLE